MAQNILQYAGEFNLDTLKFYSSKDTFADISNTVISIDLNENIYQCSVIGTIVVGDTNNLIEKLPITGQEYVDLKISTPGAEKSEDSIDFTGDRKLYVSGVIARESLTSGSQVFTLEVSTIEPLRNQNIRISKSYTKTISDIVRDILENTLQVSKPPFIEKTKGIRRIVVPNNQPFTIINQLKKEAKSEQYDSPHYLFFENKDGFHFRTFQDLVNQPIIMRFNTGDKNLDEDKNNSGSLKKIDGKLINSFNRILQYKFSNLNSWYNDSLSGMLGSTLFTHDIYTKSYTKQTFDYLNDFDKYDRIRNVKPMYNETSLRNDFGTCENSRIFVHPVSRLGVDKLSKDAQYYTDNKAQYDNSVPEDFITNRTSKMAELDSGMSINMIIQGHTGISAGSMVNINFPVVGEDHDDEIIEKSTSGNYLISHLRHSFVPVTRKHEIHLRVIKDGKGV